MVGFSAFEFNAAPWSYWLLKSQEKTAVSRFPKRKNKILDSYIKQNV